MTIRQKQKALTRERILSIAKKEFIRTGFLKTTTEEIAHKAGLAHGTIFLHFRSKEKLILEIFDRELMTITTQLHSLLQGLSEIHELLEKYLSFLIQEERFFVTVAQELPFYTPQLQRHIFFREAAIRRYFYDALESGIRQKKLQQMDITMALTYLFGTINYLLGHKKFFVSQGSVLAFKKDQLIQTFLNFIQK